MNFFGQIGGNPLTTVFILLSLLNVYYGIRVASNLRQGWSEFQRDPLRIWQKQTIDRAAFFLGIPLGVIVHELGHAITVWLFGGEVVDFGYGFYWGYVSHIGVYTPAQHWLISIAGTFGSLLYGIVAWLIFRRIPKSSYRYFALRILRVHLYYSLLYYPIFTLFTFVGDWKFIYDFDSTPLLSGITLVVHLSALGLMWWADRRGMFEMPGFDSLADQQNYEELRAEAARGSYDPQLQMRLIESYRQSSMPNTARHQANQFLKQNPKSAEGHLLMAVIDAQKKRQVPKKSRDNAELALSLGLSKPDGVAIANKIIGEYNLAIGKTDEAVNSFSEGIQAAKSADRQAMMANLYFFRATAYRRKEQYDLARQDINQAIELAKLSGQGQAMSHYEAELATIESHAGSSPNSPPRNRF